MSYQTNETVCIFCFICRSLSPKTLAAFLIVIKTLAWFLIFINITSFVAVFTFKMPTFK